MGIGKGFSDTVTKYLRLCQAPLPVMNTNDPGAGGSSFHGSFFL